VHAGSVEVSCICSDGQSRCPEMPTYSSASTMQYKYRRSDRAESNLSGDDPNHSARHGYSIISDPMSESTAIGYTTAAIIALSLRKNLELLRILAPVNIH